MGFCGEIVSVVGCVAVYMQNAMHHNARCMTAYFYTIVLQNFENPVIK